jgi:uncharacterized protein YdeI (YjbR/CyaY-like superfamily)
MVKTVKPKFFKTTIDFRKWMEKNHLRKKELYVGFYKKDSGKKSINWSQAVDVALCFGWIDGRRNAVDEKSYMNRFTPRKPGSNWSEINIKKVKALTKEGLMTPQGLKLFKERDKTKTWILTLSAAYMKKLKENKPAWKFYKASSPYYQKYAAYWVMQPKQEKTRLAHLEELIKDSEAGRRIKPMRS